MHQFFEFATRHWDLFAALAMILAMMFGGGFMRRMRGYQEADPLEVVTMVNHQEALLLDVREDAEFKEGHIINARHIPLGALKQRMVELESYKDKPVVVCCRSGHRSAAACGALRKAGFQNVTNLKGGVMAWQSSSLPLNREGNGKKRKK